MERFRDPSTVEFRTLGYLKSLFIESGLGVPRISRFQVPYLAHDFAARSFPLNDDREGLLKMIEASVDQDQLGMQAKRVAEGIHLSFQAAILTAGVPATR